MDPTQTALEEATLTIFKRVVRTIPVSALANLKTQFSMNLPAIDAVATRSARSQRYAIHDADLLHIKQALCC